LQHAASLGIVVAALVFFKIFAAREALETRRHRGDAVAHAKVEMFERAHEEQDMAHTAGADSPPNVDKRQR
jgi:hypothetical protein